MRSTSIFEVGGVNRLSEEDVRALLELVHGAHELLDLSAFRAGVLGLLREAVPCSIAAYNELEPAANRAVSFFDPAESMIFDDAGDLLARVAHSNPLIAYYAETRDGGAMKISDFLTQEELHETPLWQEAFRLIGVEYQMAFALPSQPSVIIGITLNDGERDFGERDRTLLNLARPQLVQAHRNAQVHTEAKMRLTALDRGLEASDQAVVMLRGDGRIRAMSAQGERMLGDAFGRWSRGRGRPPEELERWIAERRAATSSAGEVPWVVPSGDEKLVLRFVGRRRRGESDVIMLELRADPLSSESLQALGLTAREGEALRLAALGHPTEAIAAEMAITRATTRKHFENVYRKLGVQTRAGAVATAWAGGETTSVLAGGEV